MPNISLRRQTILRDKGLTKDGSSGRRAAIVGADFFTGKEKLR